MPAGKEGSTNSSPKTFPMDMLSSMQRIKNGASKMKPKELDGDTPSVVLYRCPVEDCKQMTSEAFIFVFDHTKHDSDAVQHFIAIMIKHLQEQHTTPFQKIITAGLSKHHLSWTVTMNLGDFRQEMSVPVEITHGMTMHLDDLCNSQE